MKMDRIIGRAAIGGVLLAALCGLSLLASKWADGLAMTSNAGERFYDLHPVRHAVLWALVWIGGAVAAIGLLWRISRALLRGRGPHLPSGHGSD